MIKKLKKFYKDHQEAIITGGCTAGATLLTSAAVFAIRARSYKVVDVSYKCPPEYDGTQDIRTMGMGTVTLYFKDGGKYNANLSPTFNNVANPSYQQPSAMADL